MSEFSEMVSRMIDEHEEGAAKELDAFIASKLLARGVAPELNEIILNRNAEPKTLTMADLKKTLDDLRPPMMFIHPADYENCKAAAAKAGFDSVEAWFADGSGILHEIFVSNAVQQGAVLHSQTPPRWKPTTMTHLPECDMTQCFIEPDKPCSGDRFCMRKGCGFSCTCQKLRACERRVIRAERDRILEALPMPKYDGEWRLLFTAVLEAIDPERKQ